MKQPLDYTVIEGVRCFSADVAHAYDDYPDAGFDLTDANAERSFWVRSRNRLFKWLVMQNRTVQGKTNLLEIGSGTGDFIRQIMPDPRLAITGSEIYLKGLVYAKRNLPGIDFVQFDVTQGVIDGRYDIITAFDVLEHVEHDEAAMANMRRMLTDDGAIIISVPQHMLLWGRLDELLKHKRRYSRAEMIARLRRNGFEPVRTTSHVFVLFPLMLISRLRDKKARGGPESDAQALESRVTFPVWVNRLFDAMMRIDEALIRWGVSLPFGGTLVVVARNTREPA